MRLLAGVLLLSTLPGRVQAAEPSPAVGSPLRVACRPSPGKAAPAPEEQSEENLSSLQAILNQRRLMRRDESPASSSGLTPGSRPSAPAGAPPRPAGAAVGREAAETQAQPGSDQGETNQPGDGTVPDNRPPPTRLPRAVPRLWSFYTTVTTQFDSNITHDPEEPQVDFGGALGLGTQYARRLSRGRTLELNYQVAQHGYAQTSAWDRMSHNAEVSLEQRLSRRWSLESTGEISLKGSTEDRDLSDQYIFRQRVNYRLNGWDRLRLFGADRLRPFSGAHDRDAANRYVGLEFRQRLEERRSWEASYRFEWNRARGERHGYHRATYAVEYVTPLGERDTLALEARHRPRQYTEPRVKVNGRRVLREDRRWALGASWNRLLGQGLELRLDYQFEFQTSNDPDKAYREHIVTMSLTRHW